MQFFQVTIAKSNLIYRILFIIISNMDKAFDNILQIEVTADDAVNNMRFEPYRFQCLFCGEEVRIAAPFSKKVIPHFRHAWGNNGNECSAYFGNGYVLSMKNNRILARENADIVYNNDKKIFEIRIRFTESQIDHYESLGAAIEIRARDKKEPFKSIKINHRNFVDDYPLALSLDHYSDYYIVSIDNKDRLYEFISLDKPTFFKVQGNSDFHTAKRVSSSEEETILFTDTRYIIVSFNPYDIERIASIKQDISYERFDIRVMDGVCFYAAEFAFYKITDEIIILLQSMKCRIERHDSICILWPPCSQKDGIYYSSSKQIIISSSYEIYPRCGNNLNNEQITKINDLTYKILSDDITRIIRKNNEMEIRFDNTRVENQDVVCKIQYLDVFKVPEDGVFVCVDIDSMCTLLKGQRVHLIPKRKIVKFKNNVPIEIIYPSTQKQISDEQIAQEKKMFYWRNTGNV